MLSIQTDKPPVIRFYKLAKEDRNETIKMGRLITKDVDMVSVKQIGEKDETERVASEWLNQLRDKSTGAGGNPPSIPSEWYERAIKLFENWQKGYEVPEDGTPVREWSILTPAQVTNLHSMQTFTVEQISNWTENAMGMYGMGGRELRDKAKLWLASGDAKAEQIHALNIENKELKDKLSKLIDEFQLLKNEVMADKPQRGRPPKSENA